MGAEKHFAPFTENLNFDLEKRSFMTFEYIVLLNLGGRKDNGSWTTIDEELNKLGEDGWELVAVSPMGKGHTGFCLKRQKQ